MSTPTVEQARRYEVARALAMRWEHVCHTEAISGFLNRAWDQLADAVMPFIEEQAATHADCCVDREEKEQLWKAVQQWQEDALEKGHEIEQLKRLLGELQDFIGGPGDLPYEELVKENARQAKEIEYLRAALTAKEPA